MQGSPVSGLVTEVIVADILNTLPAETRVVAYHDDLFIFTCTEQEAVDAKETLSRRLARSLAGELKFGTMQIIHAEEGFDALGCLFQTVRGAPVATPTGKAEEKAIHKISDLIEREKYDEARDFIRSWTSGFHLWDVRDWWAGQWLFEVDYAAAGNRAPEGHELTWVGYVPFHLVTPHEEVMSWLETGMCHTPS